METQKVDTPEVLDALLAMGVGHDAHHATVKKVVKDLTGITPAGADLKALRKSLKLWASEKGKEAGEPQQEDSGGGYVARKAFTMNSIKYRPGDEVPIHELEPKLRAKLMKFKMVILKEVEEETIHA